MYDFCFTLPYGALLIVGGLVGYLMTGSLPSLGAGVVSGLMLMGLGNISLQQYKKGRLCKPATLASFGIAIVLSGVMYQRFIKTGKIFPALVFLIVSALMSVYYAWNLLLGPLPKKSKAKA